MRLLEGLNTLAPGRPSKVNLAADCALLTVASVVATGASALSPQWVPAASTALFAVTVWLLGTRALRQYDALKGQGIVGDLGLTSVLVLATAAAVALFWRALPALAGAGSIGRLALVLWPGALLFRLTIPGLRVITHKPPDAVLIIGVGPLGHYTGLHIEKEGAPRKVFGYLALPGEREHAGLRAPVLGQCDELLRALSERSFNEVYIAGSVARHAEEMQKAVHTCELFGVPFALPASPFRLDRARPVRAEAIPDGYVHFVSVEIKPLQMVMKRLFDIAVSALVLAVLSPLLVTVAILIKLTSSGPVFFKQKRVGLYGREFNMLKFRSMVENAETLKEGLMARNEQSGPVFKITNDPRITPVGRFIRRFSIDELPQFINVLRGDMAIVGPRPGIPSEVARYEPWQHRRLSVRPGITCVWQVSGRNEISFEEWMYLDMRYIDHWSFAEDLKLILKTVPAVLTGRGAS
jgi:exopolysaccharide biosynthesis polyprenyl glycosylphosphotransferase